MPPNGRRVSGERRAEGEERVRCTRGLGRLTTNRPPQRRSKQTHEAPSRPPVTVITPICLNFASPQKQLHLRALRQRSILALVQAYREPRLVHDLEVRKTLSYITPRREALGKGSKQQRLDLPALALTIAYHQRVSQSARQLIGRTDRKDERASGVRKIAIVRTARVSLFRRGRSRHTEGQHANGKRDAAELRLQAA